MPVIIGEQLVRLMACEVCTTVRVIPSTERETGTWAANAAERLAGNTRPLYVCPKCGGPQLFCELVDHGATVYHARRTWTKDIQK